TIEHDYKLRFVSRPLPSYQADPCLLAEFRLAAGQIGQKLAQLRAVMRTSSTRREPLNSGRRQELCASLGKVQERHAPHALADVSSWRFAESRMAPTMRLLPTSRRTSHAQCRISARSY